MEFVESNKIWQKKLKYQQVDAKAAEIQTLLDDKTALLEYVISDSMVHIFRVDKGDVKWIQQPVSSQELKNKIKGLHKVLSDYILISKDASKSYQKYTDRWEQVTVMHATPQLQPIF